MQRAAIRAALLLLPVFLFAQWVNVKYAGDSEDSRWQTEPHSSRSPSRGENDAFHGRRGYNT